jgi:hypothetical protein
MYKYDVDLVWKAAVDRLFSRTDGPEIANLDMVDFLRRTENKEKR